MIVWETVLIVYLAVLATIDGALWLIMARWLYPLIMHPVAQALMRGEPIPLDALRIAEPMPQPVLVPLDMAIREGLVPCDLSPPLGEGGRP